MFALEQKVSNDGPEYEFTNWLLRVIDKPIQFF